VNKICTFLLSGQLVASMFNLLAGNFQHVQLATALAQLRTGARMNWNQAASAQHSTALDAQPLQIQVSDFTKYNIFSCWDEELRFLRC